MRLHDLILAGETQALREASFAYSQANPTCVAFKQVRGGYPSIVLFSDERNTLTQTDQLTVMLVAVRKLTLDLRSRGQGVIAADDITPLGVALYNPERMIANRPLFLKYADFFKFIKLHGRAKIFSYLTTDLRMPEMVYRKFFGEPPALTHGAHYEAFYNARLFFPAVMREARKQALLTMLRHVRDALVAAGLERVFSGDIRFVKQKASAAGLYYVDTKDMRIEPDANNSKAVVYAILHEYGHKHYYEFLTEDHRLLVRSKYYELRNAGVRFVDAKAADRKTAARKLVPGVKLRYLGKSRKMKAIGEFVVVPSKRYGKISIAGGGASYTGDPDAFLTADWHLVDDADAIAISSGSLADNFDLVTSEWFPTRYSETKHTEWYAECFAIFVLGHLQGEPAAWFAELVH